MTINFIDIGKGMHVVLLHGWGQNLNMMMPIARPLSQYYRCFVPDLFGFGGSDEVDSYCSFWDYVEQLHILLEKNHIINPIFIAHSFGARLAILYAYQYGCQALILTGAAGIKNPISLDKKMKVFLHRHHLVKSKGSLDYQQASPFLKRVLVDAVNMDLSEYCQKIEVPVLLVWGDKDDQTPQWMGQRMHELFSNSTFIVFQGQGHFAYFYEHQRFAHVCLKYLEGVI